MMLSTMQKCTTAPHESTVLDSIALLPMKIESVLPIDQKDSFDGAVLL